MVLFETMFNDMFDNIGEGDQVYHSEILNFYKMPTFENAILLLEMFKLQIPFKGEVSRTRNRKRKRSTKTQRGGYNITKTISIVKQLDVFHDIHSGYSIPTIVQNVVLSPLNLATNDESKIREELNKYQLNTIFTKNMGEILEKMSNMKSSRAILKKAHWNVELKTLLDSWMNKSYIELVIDGYFDDPTRPDNENSFSCMSITRGACLHAFIILLIGNYNTNFQPSKITEIKILTGLFQSIDLGPTYDKFLKRWVRNFKLVYPNIKLVNVQTINNPYDSNILVQNKEIILYGLHIPFIKPNIQTALTGDIDYDQMINLQNNFYVSYNKVHLKNIFDKYRTIHPLKIQTFDSFIQKVIKVNSFRDNYKADVAIQRDAIYIAMDRIAHIYYSLRVKQQNKDDNSIYYSVNGTSPANTKLFIKLFEN